MMRWNVPSLTIAAAVAMLVGGAAVSGDRDITIAGTTGDRILGEQEIKDLTAGKTFHYTLLGAPRGEEQHFTDGRVTWRLPEGTCMHGVWVVREETLCYYYGALRFGCWNVIENEDGYRHSPLEADGSPSGGASVYINRVSEEPVACTPPQLAYALP